MDYWGYLEVDNRFSVPGKKEPAGISETRFLRSDATARLTLAVGEGDVQGVVDLATVFTGFPQTDTLEDLMLRERVDPVRIESDALYLEVLDFAPGLDLRMGRQIVHWGTADQFNPTNVINAYDYEDPLKFGEAVANEMLVLKYTTPFSYFADSTTLFDDLAIELAVVPVFRPGQLPASALAAFNDPTLFDQVVDSPSLKEVKGVQDMYLSSGGEVAYLVDVREPEPDFANAQLGARMSWTLLGIDGRDGLSGFEDTPRAEDMRATGLNVPGDRPE